MELWAKAENRVWVVAAHTNELDEPYLASYECSDQHQASRLITTLREANIPVMCFGGIRCPIYRRLPSSGMMISRGGSPINVSPQVEELYRGWVPEEED